MFGGKGLLRCKGFLIDRAFRSEYKLLFEFTFAGQGLCISIPFVISCGLKIIGGGPGIDHASSQGSLGHNFQTCSQQNDNQDACFHSL